MICSDECQLFLVEFGAGGRDSLAMLLCNAPETHAMSEACKALLPTCNTCVQAAADTASEAVAGKLAAAAAAAAAAGS